MPEDKEHTNSEHANYHEIERSLKRTHACDECRQKKIKCDGGQKPDRRCTHCITHNRECTYLEPTGRSLTKRYVMSLESRIEKMERLLGQMRPEAITSAAGPSFPPPPGSGILTYGTTTLERVPGTMYRQSNIVPNSASHAGTSGQEDLDSSDDEVAYEYALVQSLRRLRVNPGPIRFFGKSSSAMLVQTAYRTKTETGENIHWGHQRPRFWAVNPWLVPELQREPPPHRPESFPDDGLMRTLIDLYFTNVNPYQPLLHRPTFERNIATCLHLRDEGFGSTVLLVCAVGARFSDDPRVFLSGYEDETLSRGWKWYKEVHVMHKSPFSLPRLYDLQICCLIAQFMEVTYSPLESWRFIGFGIRLAQDVGAYHKKVYNRKHRAEEELWKRAFWTLIMMDRYISTALGRPCAMQDEDLDLDLLLECDDEYWTNPDPGLAFRQPQGTPSYVEYFNHLLRLSQILSGAQRTIYSSKKIRSVFGVTGPKWEERLVTDLDSALNRWIDSVPDHLRWNPDQEYDLFFNQAAQLYVAFCQTQIFVHRQFLRTPRKPSAQFFPSLTICTKAARSTVRILELQLKRTGLQTFNDQASLFTSGIVLLLNIWSAKSSGVTIDIAKEMVDVHTCMSALKAGENRWHQSGRVWDVIYELIYASDLPLPQTSRPSKKRTRDGDGGDRKQRAWTTASSSVTGNSPMSHFVSSDASSPVASSSTEYSGQRPLSQMASTAEILQVPGTSSSISSSNAQVDSVDATTALIPGIQAPSVNLPTGSPPTNPAVGSPTRLMFGTPLGGYPALTPDASMMTPNAALGGEGVDPALSPMFSAPDKDDWGTLFQAIPPSAMAMQKHPLSADRLLQGTADLAGGTQEVGPPGSDNLMAMWSSMPTNFDWRDWDAYINNMDEFLDGESSSRAG